jgi:hypothetical protein
VIATASDLRDLRHEIGARSERDRRDAHAAGRELLCCSERGLGRAHAVREQDDVMDVARIVAHDRVRRALAGADVRAARRLDRLNERDRFVELIGSDRRHHAIGAAAERDNADARVLPQRADRRDAALRACIIFTPLIDEGDRSRARARRPRLGDRGRDGEARSRARSGAIVAHRSCRSR